jgi:hypothetical protein
VRRKWVACEVMSKQHHIPSHSQIQPVAATAYARRQLTQDGLTQFYWAPCCIHVNEAIRMALMKGHDIVGILAESGGLGQIPWSMAAPSPRCC